MKKVLSIVAFLMLITGCNDDKNVDTDKKITEEDIIKTEENMIKAEKQFYEQRHKEADDFWSKKNSEQK